MAINSRYIVHLQQLLRQIRHRHTAPTPNFEFLNSYHKWFLSRFGPCTSWSRVKLDALESVSATLAERSFPYADTEMKMIMGRLTAMSFFMDDSMDDEGMCNQISSFAHRLYLGQSQPPGPLLLYHETLKELSSFHESDPVLRGLAVTPWITFGDACLLERRLLTEDARLQASPFDLGGKQLLKNKECITKTGVPVCDDEDTTINKVTKCQGNPNPQSTVMGEASKLYVVHCLILL
jgi:hypothetical protein